jgi:hypothetical protein
MSRSGFNVLLTLDGVPAHPAGYKLERCWRHACVYRRSGGCTPDPEQEFNLPARQRLVSALAASFTMNAWLPQLKAVRHLKADS